MNYTALVNTVAGGVENQRDEEERKNEELRFNGVGRNA
jgi:hypothetical protein